jgi:tetratricopeptide (TPR) repeat protein
MLVVLLCGSARAGSDAEKPWAVGVTPAAQKAALDLYQDGNTYFDQAQYKEALAKYDLALQSWDHPTIHYNAAVCLINLDRPVEAYDHLLAAMRFGVAPLGKDMFAQGQSYQKLLAARVAELEVSCSEPGATVTLDGKPLFTAPGSKKQHVLAGEHQIVVEKRGFQTETKQVHLDAGAAQAMPIVLERVAAARTLHRRMPRWLPWTVMGAGAVVALVGVQAYVSAYDDYNAYEAAVQKAFDTRAGGVPVLSASDAAKLPSAHSEAMRAYVALSIGGALAATGFVLVLLNAPRLEPQVGSDHVGLVYAGRF